MIKKISCLALLAGALLAPPPALADDWGEHGEGWRGEGWHDGGRRGEGWRGEGRHGGYWGGRGAWTGGYGWRGGGYYARPYGWEGGHGGGCWRWWYGRWIWAC